MPVRTPFPDPSDPGPRAWRGAEKIRVGISSGWRRINGLPPLRSLRGSATAIGAIERLTVELKRLNNEEKTGT